VVEIKRLGHYFDLAISPFSFYTFVAAHFPYQVWWFTPGREWWPTLNGLASLVSLVIYFICFSSCIFAIPRYRLHFLFLSLDASASISVFLLPRHFFFF